MEVAAVPGDKELALDADVPLELDRSRIDEPRAELLPRLSSSPDEGSDSDPIGYSYPPTTFIPPIPVATEGL